MVMSLQKGTLHHSDFWQLPAAWTEIRKSISETRDYFYFKDQIENPILPSLDWYIAVLKYIIKTEKAIHDINQSAQTDELNEAYSNCHINNILSFLKF